MTTRQANAIDLLVDDHRKVDRMLEEAQATASPGLRSELADKIIRDLSIHAAIEEQIFYPAVAQTLPEGDPMVGESLHEHREVKELLVRLEHAQPQSREFDECLRTLTSEVRHHVEEEESRMFPRFREVAGDERMTDIAVALEAAKKIAPTRPHPHAPATPPANIVTGAAAGAVDRTRDSARARGVSGRTLVRLMLLAAGAAGVAIAVAKLVASRRQEEEEDPSRLETITSAAKRLAIAAGRTESAKTAASTAAGAIDAIREVGRKLVVRLSA